MIWADNGGFDASNPTTVQFSAQRLVEANGSEFTATIVDHTAAAE
jgi:hypothetical protein